MAGYGTILVGTDFSPLGAHALDAALSIAERTPGGRVHLAHVVPVSARYVGPAAIAPVPLPDTVLAPMLRSELDAAQARLEALPVSTSSSTVTRQARLGIPAKELTEMADEVSAELIVVATHHRGKLARFIIGSVADALIRASNVPVLVVGEDRPGTTPFAKVIAAVDLSDISARVLEHAGKLARMFGARLRVLSAFEPPLLHPPMGEMLPTYLTPDEAKGMLTQHERALELCAARAGVTDVPHDLEVAPRSARDAILSSAASWAADLIVIGTSGHNAWQRMLLGSTANKIVSEAPCPVLVIPGKPRTTA